MSLRAVSPPKHCPSLSVQNVLGVGKKPDEEISLSLCPQPLILASLLYPFHSTNTVSCRAVLEVPH